MILWFIFFVFLLVVIFFLSRSLTNNFYSFFYFLTKSERQAANLLSWLFLPGTIIHELSHLLMAELLRVPVGELNFRPEVGDGHQVRLGSLKIAKTDPLRHSLIGLAPIMTGIALISSLVYFILVPLLQKTISLDFQPINYQTHIVNSFLILVLCFLIFSLSNTMFSSKSDLETILFPVLILAILGIVFWLGNFRINLPIKLINFLNDLLKVLDFCLLATIVVDSLFLLLTKLLLSRK